MSIYYYLFSKYMVVEVSQVSDDQKQALVNAIKYVCSPTPLRQQTPQREFALQSYNKDLDYANLFCIFIEKGQKKSTCVL